MVGSKFISLAVAALSLLSGVNAVEDISKRTLFGGHWVNTWVSMPQLTEPHNLPPAPFTGADIVFKDSTIRQTIHSSIGGNKIRIRISNQFATTDLPITAVTVALPADGKAGISAIQPRTLKHVTFSGEKSVVIPYGAVILSDPIDFTVKPDSNVAITIYTKEGQTTLNQTSHPGSRTTSWLAHGNQVAAADLSGESKASTAHWYFISGVEVWAPKSASGFVIVGDSITDGRGSTTDGNDRWPNLLYKRMLKHRATRDIAVLNQAAGGNRILNDGLGPNALGRIDRDVIVQAGTKYALIFEGVNDIGTAATDEATQKLVGDRLIWAFKQMVTRLHTFGIPVFAATITPFSGDPAIQGYSHPEREKTRQRVNKFIRTSKVFDAVIDFDAIVRNQTNPSQIATQYDTGDYLHLNTVAYQAIADKFPLELFERFRFGSWA